MTRPSATTSPATRRPLGKADALVRAGMGGERTADLSAGCVAAGVKNSGEGMSAFARAQEFAAEGLPSGLRRGQNLRPTR